MHFNLAFIDWQLHPEFTTSETYLERWRRPGVGERLEQWVRTGIHLISICLAPLSIASAFAVCEYGPVFWILGGGGGERED